MNPAAVGILRFALVGLMMAGAVVVVFEVAPPFPKEGSITVLFVYAAPRVEIQGDQNVATQASQAADGSPNGPIVVRLEVTIDSVQVRSGTLEDTGWTEVSSETVTLDLMRQSGETVMLGSANIAEQNITMVRLHVASASATVEGISGREVKVPSGEFKIPLTAQVRGQLTTSITISPDSVHIVTQTDPIIVTPVLHVEVNGPE